MLLHNNVYGIILYNKNNNIVLIKSWNEWGEGNYLEPDVHYGRGMLEALRDGKC